MRLRIPLALLALFLTVSTVRPCSLCGSSTQNRQSLRQELGRARFVLYGRLANARLNPKDPLGASGTTDLLIEEVLKTDPAVAGKKVIELPRYVPLNPKAPIHYVVFCDVYNGKLDPYIGLEVKSGALVDYLRGVLTLGARDRTQSLLYYFNYLDHRDAEIAADAFLEFAKATDPEIGQVANQLNPEKLRKLLQDPLTPTWRIGLFAFLLGACGGPPDANFLHQLMQRPTQNTAGALGGLLGGYIELRPREGWELTRKLLADGHRPFSERLSVLGTLRFYHGWKPNDVKSEVITGLGVLLPQGDIADLAIEDLRRWQYWDLTPAVLSQFGKKSHDAPIMKRAIVRYAITCPRAEAVEFMDKLRKQDPELVKDVEEGLRFEKDNSGG